MRQKNVLLLIAVLLLSLGISASNPEKTKLETSETTENKEAQLRKAERPLVTAFFGGMMLTKIKLESLTSLVPYAHQDDDDFAERCESLAGLVVFHRADKSDKSMPSGMYVWDGEIWQCVSSSPLAPMSLS